MKLKKQALVASLMTLFALPCSAHEFWLDAQVTGSNPEPQLALEFRVGQKLDGVLLPFVPDQVVRFQRLGATGAPLEGRLGDTVAATTSFDQENGFAGFVEMAARQVEHTNWQAFLTYLETEGLSAIQEKHLERGLPKTGFTETYARHAKLIRLGTNPVASVPENQANAKFEINLVEVAKPNAKRLHIRGALLLDGRPLANHQVTVLSMGSPELNISRVLTNDKGTFQVSLNLPARVLFNSVSMAASTGNSAVWHSDWASLLLLP